MPEFSQLDLILSNACPSNDPDENDGVAKFYVETHCVAWWIEAKATERITNDLGEYVCTKYEILSMKSEPC